MVISEIYSGFTMVFLCRLRDCAEDVLVELSEILFNELAFFHIMQDLNPSKAMIRASVRKWREGQVRVTLILYSVVLVCQRTP